MVTLKTKIAYFVIILAGISILSSCQKDPQKAAEKCVEDFIQALWDNDDAKGDASCIVISTESGPVSAYRLSKLNQVKINPNDIKIVDSFQNISNIHNNIVVIAEYNDQPIWFLVQFYNGVEQPDAADINEKLYTKDKPRILSTMGLYEFDNNSFVKTNGFEIRTREESYPNYYDCYSDDMTPYLIRDALLKKSKVLNVFLKNRGDNIRILNGSCGSYCVGGSLFTGPLNETFFRFECSDDSAHWIDYYGEIDINGAYPLKSESN